MGNNVGNSEAELIAGCQRSPNAYLEKNSDAHPTMLRGQLLHSILLILYYSSVVMIREVCLLATPVWSSKSNTFRETYSPIQSLVDQNL